MQYNEIAERIIELKKEDLALRAELLKRGQLNEGYNAEMERLHNKNVEVLNDIIETIGYPSIDKVGKKGSEAAWLVIQHAIGQPDFMKKCLKLLERAVDENKADPINLAYLTDRIAVFEGRLQSYGTQFDWDENGVLSPNPFDDLVKVNQRRKFLGLHTIQEQTSLMRQRAENENQKPPIDLEKRRIAYDNWRKKVGWIT